jgi:phage repressor protein C with HTH and peptisase S24 domain
MIENFRKMVLRMRTAQKKYFKLPTKFGLEECKRLESAVDRWLEENAQEEVKLELWGRSGKSTETPGVYNLIHESKEEKASRE